MMDKNLKNDLEHFKGWLHDYLLKHDYHEAIWGPDWNIWVDWHMTEINHAIDHLITDHCQD